MLYQTPPPPDPIIAIVTKVEEKPKEPIKYVVKANDNLTKIATAHQTTVQRLWAKNTDLANPNILTIGQTLLMPENVEILPDRPLPIESPPETIKNVPGTYSGDSSGNSYGKCQCTFYAKMMRPDLPNSLGNANSWYARYNGPKGSEPRVGAIGMFTSYMHVSYVEAVNGDQVQISEWNYAGPCQKTVRWVPASDMLYIY